MSDRQLSEISGMPREAKAKGKQKGVYSKNVSQLKIRPGFPGTSGQISENAVNLFPEFPFPQNPNNFYLEMSLKAAFTIRLVFCSGIQI